MMERMGQNQEYRAEYWICSGNRTDREYSLLRKAAGKTVMFFWVAFFVWSWFSQWGMSQVQAEQLASGEKIYLKVTDDWKKDGAKFYMYYFIGGVSENQDERQAVQLDPVDGDDHLYTTFVPDSKYTTIIFVRMNPSYTDNGYTGTFWTNRWNQTPNISLESFTDTVNTYQITGWTTGIVNGWSGGKYIYIMNMDEEHPISTITAVFSDNTNYSQEVTATQDASGYYQVQIPEDRSYTSVDLKNGDQVIASNVNFSIAATSYRYGSTNRFYYAVTEKDGETKTILNDYYKRYIVAEESLAGKSLYLDANSFGYDGTGNFGIKYGNVEDEFALDEDGIHYKYQFPYETSAKENTILTVSYKGNRYRCFWNDANSNILSLSNDIARISGKKDYVVYFDATLSKLSYQGSVDADKNQTIPLNGDTVYFKATEPEGGSGTMYGSMTLLRAYSKNGHTWSNVYKAYLDQNYTHIQFGNQSLKTSSANGAGFTADSVISSEKRCFYADTSDDSIYRETNREGTWGEVYTIRDVEGTENGKGLSVVQLSTETFVRQNDTLYLNSTFYDYYTDYELNGKVRNQQEENNWKQSQRNWVTFRQLNQALSDYYRTNEVRIPLYIGHFQPPIFDNHVNEFKDIEGTLNLYGYNQGDNTNQFYSTNNSNMDANGNRLTEGDLASVAQGLVKNQLIGNQVQAVTDSSGNADLPLFSESFLTGANSKNTVLGKIYSNVQFPFTQKADDNGINYWQFDASTTTLAMRKDQNQYYLKNMGGLQSWSKNCDPNLSQKETYGFFPFNEHLKSGGNAIQYNFGYGVKLEIPFHLSNDGTVLDKDLHSQPITFEFSGDDDVWVFIDGKLVLDVGGDHTTSTGVIDFHSKTATINSGVKTSAANALNLQTLGETYSFEIDYTKPHTLTMFYMERGMWDSNMKLILPTPKSWINSVKSTFIDQK